MIMALGCDAGAFESGDGRDVRGVMFPGARASSPAAARGRRVPALLISAVPQHPRSARRVMSTES